MAAIETFYNNAEKPSYFDETQNKVYDRKILHLTEIENRYRMASEIYID